MRRRELKALIKGALSAMGRVATRRHQNVFSNKGREDYLEQLPAEEERRMMRRLYGQHDHALAQWKETLQEVEARGWRVLGSAPVSAHSPEWARWRRMSLAQSLKSPGALPQAPVGNTVS